MHKTATFLISMLCLAALTACGDKKTTPASAPASTSASASASTSAPASAPTPAQAQAPQRNFTQIELLQIENARRTAERELFIKNYAAAEEAYATITKINDADFLAWHNTGVIRMFLGKTAAAGDAYKKSLATSEAALARDANNQGALNTRLQALIYFNRVQEARDALARAAKDNPGNAAYQEMSQKDAVATFVASLVNNYTEGARQKVTQKDYAAAEEMLLAITKLNDSNYIVWREIGVLRVWLNKPSAARDAYKKSLAASEAAFAKNAGDQNALVTRLQVLILLNRAQDARDVIARVARDNPGNAAYQELNKTAVDTLLAQPQMKTAILP